MKTLENLYSHPDEKGVVGLRGIVLSLKKIRMSTSVNSNPKGSTHQPKALQKAIFVFSEKLVLCPLQPFPLVPANPSPANPSLYSPLDLTRAPLLSRIMKMMKVSNQLCSTMRKQVFLRIHQDLPSPSSMLTWQHLNRWTQPGTSGRGRSDRGSMPYPALPSPPPPRPHLVLPHHTARRGWIRMFDSEMEGVAGLGLCCKATRTLWSWKDVL